MCVYARACVCVCVACACVCVSARARVPACVCVYTIYTRHLSVYGRETRKKDTFSLGSLMVPAEKKTFAA